jgi:uncharacterized protein YyaL (SSP411 family)
MASKGGTILGMMAVIAVITGIGFLAIGGDKGEQMVMPAADKTTDHGRNRLQYEQSPYLLQHADNPVDWYPWGEEAFAKARREDKPVFLSIGYSTCHWCHVMEHESFEDEEVAELLNDAFVCIKVDREERPDVDNIYMAACQMMKQRGGWPLTIIMTPDKKPFFAGTYFPKESRFGRRGMDELIPSIKDMWANQREQINNTAGQITQALQQTAGTPTGTELGRLELDLAYRQLGQRFDQTYGGFGAGMKFPTPHNFMYLLRYYHRTGDQHALQMVEHTLQQMRRGGIFDHVGFGFHRYSTDRQWLVPHFEKMLYDQALMALAYAETYQLTRNEEYARTAREIFAYILRDMTAPEGGFYSAEDADSEGEEGKFYLWTVDEVREVLDAEEAELFIAVFNLTAEGNFTEASRPKSGTNIPHLKSGWARIAAAHHLSPDDLSQKVEKIRHKLFTKREDRIHPAKDDKILTDWNGLMIAALAKAAQVLNQPEYATVAARAADFFISRMRDDHGGLLHRYRNGAAAIPGNCEDYAFLIWGLLELYEVTFEVNYLQQALAFNDDMLQRFWDHEAGGLYFSAEGMDDLIVRQKEAYDGAIPSGNSVAMLNLLRLGRMTGRTELEEKAGRLLRAFSRQVGQTPSQYTMMMSALDFAVGPTNEVIIVGRPGAPDTKKIIAALNGVFNPQKVSFFHADDGSTNELEQLAEFIKYHQAIDGKATAYVCRNYTCELPTTESGKMLALLKTPASP